MSEIKRAQLIPLGSQKESDKSSKEPRKTIRISVVLPESTEDTCPEYNYKDELAAAKVTFEKMSTSLLALLPLSLHQRDSVVCSGNLGAAGRALTQPHVALIKHFTFASPY